MMSSRNYLQLTGLIFSVVALVHVYRLFSGLSLMIGNWAAPMWVSVVGAVVAGFLAYNAFSMGNKKR